jgi:3'-phosphoadenosine 5'-phosphosulfate sulfotransferase (PAPS reductase)/FAD synthetase
MTAGGTQLPGLESHPLTLDDALAETAETMGQAITEHQPSRRFLLFSGGNDSLVVLDALAGHADEVVHVNTGIGIPETTEFARRVAGRYGLPYAELTPSVPYEWLVLNRWDGMPGPGAHRFTYTMLKERCIETLLREHRQFRGERFMLLTGARSAESRRRMGAAAVVRRKGGQVWVNPLLRWTNEQMAEYRQGQSLPVNEVSANLHMSGECLCGAMADQDESRGEREMIRFFYPGFDKRLTGMENECRSRGLPYAEWGVKRCDEKGPAGPMCSSCEGRQPSLFDESPVEIAGPSCATSPKEAA